MDSFLLEFISKVILANLCIYGIYSFFEEKENLFSLKNLKMILIFSFLSFLGSFYPEILKFSICLIALTTIIYFFYEVNIFQAFIGSALATLILLLSEILCIATISFFIDFDLQTLAMSNIDRIKVMIIVIFYYSLVTKLLKNRVRNLIFSNSVFKKSHIKIINIFLIFTVLTSSIMLALLNINNNLTEIKIYYSMIFLVVFLGILYLVYKLDSKLNESITDNPDDIKKEILPGRILVNGKLIKLASLDTDSGYSQ
ncbi:putative membrane protein [Acetoanaerobium pronyense]|uniref:Membrane protein n=1 Tax=Acetoanaerobium pronyense TaxID=1482736 RepID=A0ABS4KK25_9FIRM|nr:hypothetical protein [Acetoanaerobium pronyense]MBP2028135.1 putative membrane protein [Acetoanaerobium pronyense]